MPQGRFQVSDKTPEKANNKFFWEKLTKYLNCSLGQLKLGEEKTNQISVYFPQFFYILKPVKFWNVLCGFF